MKKYQLLHQEVSVSPFTLGIVHRGFHQRLHLKYTAPLFFKNSVIVYKNTCCDWYGDYDNFKKLGAKIIENARKNKNYKNNLLKDTKEIGQILFQENKKINQTNLKKFTLKELSDSLKKIYNLGGNLCDVGMVAAAPDVAFDNFSKLLKQRLTQKINISRPLRTANEYFNILTNHGDNGLSTQENLSILKMAAEINKQTRLKKIIITNNPQESLIILQKEFPQAYQKINKIHINFSWLGFGHFGPVKNISDYVTDLKNLLLENNVPKKIKSLASELKQLRIAQANCFKELKFSSSDKQLFYIAQNFSYNKSFRYEMLLYTHFILDKILNEIATRISVPVPDLRFYSPEEINISLKKGKGLAVPITKSRQKLCVVIIHQKGVKHLIGAEAKAYIKANIIKPEVKKEVTTIHGTAASLGRVTGYVKIVNEAKDMAKVQIGDILVSVQTTPDLVPAMKKAAAFVTDIGGITSHAAIVAREMKKPCIIGTKFASQLLKDGDLVDVNANEGDIKKIN